MLRSFHLPIVSFCILLTFANCENNCQNLQNGDELAKLQNQYLTVFNQNQDLSKQIYELADQRDAILRAKEELDGLMDLKAQLETELAKLQAEKASRPDIEDVKRRLKKVEEDIANKNAKIGRMEANIQTAQDTANAAKAKAGMIDGLQVQIADLRAELQTNYATIADKDAIWGKIGELETRISNTATKDQRDILQTQIDDLEKKLRGFVTQDKLDQKLAELKDQIVRQIRDWSPEIQKLEKLINAKDKGIRQQLKNDKAAFVKAFNAFTKSAQKQTGNGVTGANSRKLNKQAISDSKKAVDLASRLDDRIRRLTNRVALLEKRPQANYDYLNSSIKTLNASKAEYENYRTAQATKNAEHTKKIKELKEQLEATEKLLRMYIALVKTNQAEQGSKQKSNSLAPNKRSSSFSASNFSGKSGNKRGSNNI